MNLRKGDDNGDGYQNSFAVALIIIQLVISGAPGACGRRGKSERFAISKEQHLDAQRRSSEADSSQTPVRRRGVIWGLFVWRFGVAGGLTLELTDLERSGSERMRGICGPVMATAVGLEAIPSTSSPSSSSSSREKSKRKFRADLASPPGAQFFQQEENHHHHHHDGDVAAGNGSRGEDGNGLMNWGPDDAVSRDLGGKSKSKSKSLSLDGDGGADVEDVAAKDTEECVHKVDEELGLGGGGGGGDGMGQGMGGEVGVGLDAIVAGDCCEELENNWKTEPEPELEELLVTSLEAVFNDVIRKIVVQGFSKEEALKVFSKQAGWLREGGSVVPASIVEDALTYLAETGRRISSSDPNNVNNAPLGSSNLVDDGKALQRRILFSMLKKLRENRPALSRGDAMWCLLMSDMNVENALSFEDNISHSPLQLSKTMSGSPPSPSPSPFPNPSPEGTNLASVSNASTEILAESCSPVSSSSPSNGEILRASSIPPSTPPPQVEGLSAGEESRVSRDLSMGQKPDSSSLESSSTSGCLPTMVVADWSQATRLEESINKTEEEAENRVVGSEELQGQGSSGGSGGAEEHLSNSPGKEVDKNLQQEDGGSSSTSPSGKKRGCIILASLQHQKRIHFGFCERIF